MNCDHRIGVPQANACQACWLAARTRLSALGRVAEAAAEFRDQMLSMYGAGIGTKVYELDEALATAAELEVPGGQIKKGSE